MVLELYPKRLTTGELSAVFADRVVEDMRAGSKRPLLSAYAAVFIAATYVIVRDGQVGDHTFCAEIAVDLADIGTGSGCGACGVSEGAKPLMSVLTDLRNCVERDVFFGWEAPDPENSAVGNLTSAGCRSVPAALVGKGFLPLSRQDVGDTAHPPPGPRGAAGRQNRLPG